MTSKSRKVSRIVQATQTSDGAGVRLKRSLGTPQLDYLDPFLLLDEFKSDDRSDYIAGFPDHPHRGFETVTYMLAGSMEHKDHKGNQGTLVSGSVQWMTAGKGIIHSEMPKQEDGLMWGFQLWVNLPAADKMREPRYQEFTPEEIPVANEEDGTTIRVIAGESSGVKGAVQGIATEPLYLDVTLPPEKRIEQPVTEGHNAFAYVFEGEGELGEVGAESERSVESGQMALFSNGDHIVAAARDVPFRFLLLAARPLNEPMARYGPFVMNNEDEIRQAFRDYREGRF
jgi:redox-sensitive bicupin YhaK (pirin superfamily)